MNEDVLHNSLEFINDLSTQKSDLDSFEKDLLPFMNISTDLELSSLPDPINSEINLSKPVGSSSDLPILSESSIRRNFGSPSRFSPKLGDISPMGRLSPTNIPVVLSSQNSPTQQSRLSPDVGDLSDISNELGEPGSNGNGTFLHIAWSAAQNQFYKIAATLGLEASEYPAANERGNDPSMLYMPSESDKLPISTAQPVFPRVSSVGSAEPENSRNYSRRKRTRGVMEEASKAAVSADSDQNATVTAPLKRATIRLTENQNNSSPSLHHSKVTQVEKKIDVSSSGPSKNILFTPTASSIPSAPPSIPAVINPTNNMKKHGPRATPPPPAKTDLSTLLMSFGDPTKVSQASNTNGGGTTSGGASSNMPSAATSSSGSSRGRKSKNANNAQTAIPSLSAFSSQLVVPPQLLKTSDRALCEFVHTAKALSLENAALREQLRLLSVSFSSTSSNASTRSDRAETSPARAEDGVGEESPSSDTEKARVAPLLVEPPPSTILPPSDEIRLEQLAQIVQMARKGAPEATLRRAIIQYKDKYSDFGRERQNALLYHLHSLKRLLLPNQVTRLSLYSIAGAARSVSTPPPASESGAVDNNINSTQTSTTTNDGTEYPTASNAHLFSEMSQALNLTEDQQRKMMQFGDSVERRAHDFADMLLQLRLLEERVASNFVGLEHQMSLIMSHLVPVQMVRFLEWMEENSSIFDTMEPLQNWDEQVDAFAAHPAPISKEIGLSGASELPFAATGAMDRVGELVSGVGPLAQSGGPSQSAFSFPHISNAISSFFSSGLSIPTPVSAVNAFHALKKKITSSYQSGSVPATHHGPVAAGSTTTARGGGGRTALPSHATPSGSGHISRMQSVTSSLEKGTGRRQSRK